ncbi:MAG: YeaH/YhbH family protein [Candidatus Pelagadaptatus aseana]|uniref:YeaH/YhbH family protein n=1 Tax=Candidatus Pelagadaptatus aseana TaxID=3120508 RepID=UPI0039B20C44
MAYIIDRRLNSKNKSAVNRQRFLRRYRKHIKKAVSDAVNKRSITDMERGEKISIPNKDISEPTFHHGKGGLSERVLPGNHDFVSGDNIPRPQGGGGSGGSGNGASDSGEGMDEFVFQITQDEFLDFMFDDLELPNLVKRQLAGNEEFKMRRAGFSEEGSPGRVNIVRTLRSANARRMALTGGKRKRVKLLEQQLEQQLGLDKALQNQDKIHALREEIEQLQARIKRVPWLDDFDLKYNLHVKQPIPRSKAVMFCLMDVSGSMTQATKDMAKRFFILLYLFLQRNYEHTEVVFIRHHTSAKEVDEEEFFYSRETGGTIVSSALRLLDEILEKRYPVGEWNIYCAQASDGDNWNDDSSSCSRLLMENLLPKMQYYSYIEITPRDHQALWQEYEQVQANFPEAFAMQQIVEPGDIYPVFRQLFQKKGPQNS